jgi:saccharopine dehydrogenase-like NADP-dependent oxidoreductase
MSKVLIIGAGGVGQVVTHKCAQRRDIFSEITLASRTKSKCDMIAAQLGNSINTAQVNANNVLELVTLIKKLKPKLVINVALPYQDLHIMDACLECGVDYLDTANYEPLDSAKFKYSWQRAYQERFKQAGIMALLGSGFYSGVTKGKTCIGAVARGTKEGQRKQVYIYDICEHEASYKEVPSHAISYTAGLPAVVGAIMMLSRKWYEAGVFNMEQFDPELFFGFVTVIKA